MKQYLLLATLCLPFLAHSKEGDRFVIKNEQSAWKIWKENTWQVCHETGDTKTIICSDPFSLKNIAQDEEEDRQAAKQLSGFIKRSSFNQNIPPSELHQFALKNQLRAFQLTSMYQPTNKQPNVTEQSRLTEEESYDLLRRIQSIGMYLNTEILSLPCDHSLLKSLKEEETKIYLALKNGFEQLFRLCPPLTTAEISSLLSYWKKRNSLQEDFKELMAHGKPSVHQLDTTLANEQADQVKPDVKPSDEKTEIK